MSGELFRQDGKSKGERAVVQGEDGSKLNRKPVDGASVGEQAEKQRHEGPVIDVDSYNDRFERAEPGERQYKDFDSEALIPKIAAHSTADALKAEIDEIASLEPIAWDLPAWRSAQLSREILEKLSKTIDQLKVVMKASDSLSGQVNGLYEVEKSFRAEEETEHSLKIKRKRHKMSENETPKDEDLNEEASLEENSGSVDGAEESVEISNDDAEGPDEGNQEPVSDVAVAAADATLAEAIHLADELVKTRIEKIHEAGERSVTQAVQSMETLMGSVLDSAEAATKASATANVSTGNLVKAARKLDDSSYRSSKTSTIVLSVGGAMLFISVAVFGFMAAQLSKRSADLESMVLAVGKRVVEMNVGLEQFQIINDSIEQLRFTQEAFRDAQIELTERMNELNGSLQIVQNELPAKAAESVGRQSEAFTARVGEVETQIKSQQKITVDLAKSMQGLAGQVSSLRKQISGVDELNKDVQALVTLQRERYYELLQSQAQKVSAAETSEEVLIQYPNPEAPLPMPEIAN